MTLLRITWKKSFIGRRESQRRVIRALGLRRLHQMVEHSDSPTIRGMVNKVIHMVDVEQVEEAPQPKSRARTRSASKKTDGATEVDQS
jgi:large subunit ribosomal protein L30